jgi:3',5'-nucleoside bisphosphate phosphatase
MFEKGDFHIHSKASDGDLTPREVVELAKRRGVDIIALTDHNTTLGVGDALRAGIEYGVSVIPGVELSTRFHNERIHILGYFKDDRYKSQVFQKILKLIKAHKTKNAQILIKRLSNIDIDIDRDSGRLSVLGGIRLLRIFGASVVLAHPVLINKKYLTEIINMPFDGIEAKYCRNSEDDTEFFIRLSKDMEKFYTAGSDFHTDRTRDLKHGLIGDVYLNSHEIDIFLKMSGLIDRVSTYKNFISYNYNSEKYERIKRNMYCYPYRQVIPANSYFRMMNASFNAPALDIYANGILILSNFQYKEVSPYMFAPIGNHNIEVYISGDRTNPIIQQNITIPRELILNLAIIGAFPDISIYPLPEPSSAQKFGRPCVRFINLSPKSSPMDIALPDETIIFRNLGYREFTEYACILEGRYSFQIRSAGTEKVILTTKSFQLNPNNYYSVYILGEGSEDKGIEVLTILEPRE